MDSRSISDELSDAVKKLGIGPDHFRRVTSDEAGEIIDAIERLFLDRNTRPWWENLRSRSLSVAFRDQRGFERLPKIVPSSDTAWFVADDPWTLSLLPYKASASAIKGVLGESTAFEYYIVSGDMDWLICENHHGFLIAVGLKAVDRLRSFALQHPDEVQQMGEDFTEG
jgi:hypothetical protein